MRGLCGGDVAGVGQRSSDSLRSRGADVVMPIAGPGGSPLSGGYIGTLSNNGVGLAPFHDFDAKVPDGLKTELEQVSSPNSPR
jgi:basic membrane protein A